MKLIKPLLFSTLLSTLALPFTASALPLIDVHAGVGGWIAGASGDIQVNASDLFDAEADLDLDDQTNVYGYLSFEHPTPIVPNLRVGYTQLTTDGEDDDTLDLTMLDATIYYGVGAIWATADVGVNVRQLTADANIQGESGETDVVFPMLYAKARINLPLTDTYLIAEGQGISVDGNSVMDYSGRIGYEGFLGLGLEAGFRTLKIELNDVEDVTADLELSGPFAGVQFSF